MKIKIRYINGMRLKRSIIASANKISEHQAYINKINVFPVADADTPNKLQIWKKAGVVDAAAQGFVPLLEGLTDFIEHGKIVALKARTYVAKRVFACFLFL